MSIFPRIQVERIETVLSASVCEILLNVGYMSEFFSIDLSDVHESLYRTALGLNAFLHDSDGGHQIDGQSVRQ